MAQINKGTAGLVAQFIVARAAVLALAQGGTLNGTVEAAYEQERASFCKDADAWGDTIGAQLDTLEQARTLVRGLGLNLQG